MGAHISAETPQDQRLNMVNGQLRTGGIVDQAVLAAFLATPRERFVAPAYASLAYLDRELPALGAKARRLLAPHDVGADAAGGGGESRRSARSMSGAAPAMARPSWI